MQQFKDTDLEVLAAGLNLSLSFIDYVTLGICIILPSLCLLVYNLVKTCLEGHYGDIGFSVLTSNKLPQTPHCKAPQVITPEF